MKKKLILLILALLTLPIVIFVTKQVQRLLSRAAYQPANIIIDTQNIVGPVNKVWSSFSQGGEEPPPMLSATVAKMKELSPQFIRLDHIYDSYSVVQREGDGFKYDFSQLDKTVDDILAMGALPFFTLSYMPSVFTSSGSLIDPPSDWNWWKDLVKKTIEHYSGKNGKNLPDVYYEVWNEPELPAFGSWKLSAEKDYRLLYFYAATGASETQNVNNFYIGGPSVGSYYPAWINGLLSYITQNNLRFDFYSWHRYTKKPIEYSSDAQKTRKILMSFPQYANIPLFLTEWGIESENTTINNSNTAAAYTISATAQLQNEISLAFVFEIKDGPPPNGGKWGLLTHEKDQPPLSPKPRFKAFAALNKLKGKKVSVSGEGTFVNCLAAKSDKNITAILGNYDLSGKNSENVPVTFTGLTSPSYNLKYSYPLTETSGTYELGSPNGIITKNFLLSPNSILILELSPSQTTPFIPGKSGLPGDQALLLAGNQNPLAFRAPTFQLAQTGSISFDIKPLWEKDDNISFIIFEAPFLSTEGSISKLFLAKQKTTRGNLLAFAVRRNKDESKVNFPIDNWEKGSWHHLDASWSESSLSLSVDGGNEVKTEGIINIRRGTMLTFYPVDAAVDNLKINMDGKEVVQRTFDGGIDR